MLPELRAHARAEVGPQVMSDLALAHEAILGLPKHAVVLTKNGKVAAKVTAESPSAAYAAAARALQHFYASRGWIRPWQNIAAVINFAPTLDIDTGLGGAGVDAILALEHPPAHVMEGKWARPGPEEDIVRKWIEPRQLPHSRARENLLRALFFPA